MRHPPASPHASASILIIAGLALAAATSACSDASTSPPPPPPPPPPVAPGTFVVHFSPANAGPRQADTLLIYLPLPADTAHVPVVLEFSGLARGRDSVSVPSGTRELYAAFVVPHSVADGALIATAFLPLRNAYAADTLPIRDTLPPSLFGSAHQQGPAPLMPDMPPGDRLFRAGSTVDLHVRAADDNGVAWVGFAAGAPVNVRDSVATSLADSVVEGVISLNVPADAAGQQTGVTFFARDIAGHLTEAPFGTTSIYGVVSRPVRTAPLTARVRDAAVDEKRGVIYLSQPDSDRIAVLSLATLEYQAPIQLPLRPAGLDLSVSGDSLVIALHGTAYLGIVDLTSSPPRFDTVRVQYTAQGGPVGDTLAVQPFVEDVRVAADGRAIVSLVSPDLGYDYDTQADHVVVVDLATGAQQIGYSDYAPPQMPIVRTPDRQTVLVLNTGNGGATTALARRYDAATHALSPVEGGSPYTQYPPFASVSRDGAYYLLGASLFDARLDPIVAMLPAGYQSRVSAITPQGADAFFAAHDWNPSGAPPPTDPAYVIRYRLPNGQLTEFASTPQLAYRLFMMPDGQTLIGTGPTEIMAIDLREGVAVAAARRVGSRIAAARHDSIPPATPARAADPVPTIVVKLHPSSRRGGGN